MSAARHEKLAAEFASVWGACAAPPPDVRAFLRQHPGASADEILAVLLTDLQRRYEAGCPLAVEVYLREFPVLDSNRERKLDLVYADYRTACQFGTTPEPSALLTRFPDLADALRQHLAVENLLAATVHGSGPRTHPDSRVTGEPPPTPDAPSGYEWVRELGRGGCGTVWLARHLALDKFVAVKHLRAEQIAAAQADLLVREARTMGSLKVHPNRVTVFDLVRTGAGWFLVMDYIAGGPLSGLTAPDRPLDWVRAVRYVLGAAEGLMEVHERGILHRDIKPENILLDPERDVAVLTDFGLAAHFADATACCGTLGYMAPEVFGGTVSVKTDVFALAATLCHLVAGRKPFDSRALVASRAEVSAGPSGAVLARLPDAVVGLVRAGLDPNPDIRPDLAAFTALLRTCHTCGLATRLRALAREQPGPVKLQVTVSTANERDLIFRTVFSGPVTTGTSPVRCEDVVRIETTADADGYLTVLNLSSGGEVGVLFPNPRVPDNRIRAGRAQRLTVKLTPPAGTDHAVLVWTPAPCPLSAREWRAQIESGRLTVTPHRERGMEFVDLDVADHPTAEFVAEVVGIEHGT
jgi:tRNA A-37 threonylcarbamoyl transferase component Bud32